MTTLAVAEDVEFEADVVGWALNVFVQNPTRPKLKLATRHKFGWHRSMHGNDFIAKVNRKYGRKASGFLSQLLPELIHIAVKILQAAACHELQLQALPTHLFRSQKQTWRFVTSGDCGTRAQPESSITIYNIAECELDCFAYLCHHPLHWSRLSNRALIIGPCHCSDIFVSCLVFRVHVAGDVNHKISFVAGRSTRFSACFRGISRLRSACIFFRSGRCLEYVRSRFIEAFFSNIIHIRFNAFWSNGFTYLHITLDFNSNPMNGSHSRITSNER